MSKLLARSFQFTAQFFLGFYRTHLSGVMGGVCRYEPSCSCYAQQAFERFSPGYALYLTVRRLLRCHPFASYGWDPVPPAHSCHHGEHLEQQC